MLSETGKDLLTNKGIVVLNADNRAKPHSIIDSVAKGWARLSSSSQVKPSQGSCDPSAKTIIVVGCGRGGTSIVSGALHSLGVFMGDTAGAPTFEDTKLATAFEQKNTQAIEQIINDYNARYTLWGFKRPASVSYLHKLHTTVRNPRYIFIFKDLLAIGNRNVLSMHADPLDEMTIALKHYGKMLRFIKNQQPVAMLLSAEKILQHKAYFITELCKFLELQPTTELIAQAENFIEPDPGHYLDRSRITKALGEVEEISESAVKGWAKFLHRPGIHPLIELFVNDLLIAESPAGLFRQDLLDSGQHALGNIGFEISLDRPLKTGDILRVKVKDEVNDLCVRQF